MQCPGCACLLSTCVCHDSNEEHDCKLFKTLTTGINVFLYSTGDSHPSKQARQSADAYDK